MIDKAIVSNFVSTAVDTPEIAFTALADTTITSFTATNNTTSNKTYKAYINSVSEPVIPLTILVRDKNHTGAGIVGQLIPEGASLYLETSAIGSISFYVTGSEKSS